VRQVVDRPGELPAWPCGGTRTCVAPETVDIDEHDSIVREVVRHGTLRRTEPLLSPAPRLTGRPLPEGTVPQTTDPVQPVHVRSGSWARWVRRWLSVGGLVTALGVGNVAAALNWNAIMRGLAGDGGTVLADQASAASQRYAILGFALLVVGQHMVTRRALLDHEA
jgi:hypothetical protein